MAQRDSSKTSMTFIDDKTVLLSVGDLTTSADGQIEALDEESPEVQELRDSLLMALSQIAGPKPH